LAEQRTTKTLSITTISITALSTQYNNIRHNYTRHTTLQCIDTQHNDNTEAEHIQHNSKQMHSGLQ
jgi:hypothetical protein